MFFASWLWISHFGSTLYVCTLYSYIRLLFFIRYAIPRLLTSYVYIRPVPCSWPFWVPPDFGYHDFTVFPPDDLRSDSSRAAVPLILLLLWLCVYVRFSRSVSIFVWIACGRERVCSSPSQWWFRLGYLLPRAINDYFTRIPRDKRRESGGWRWPWKI